jgi:hypothetical protein
MSCFAEKNRKRKTVDVWKTSWKAHGRKRCYLSSFRRRWGVVYFVPLRCLSWWWDLLGFFLWLPYFTKK